MCKYRGAPHCWLSEAEKDVQILEDSCYGENMEPSSKKNDKQRLTQVGGRIHKMKQLPLEVYSKTVSADHHSPLHITDLPMTKQTKKPEHIQLLPQHFHHISFHGSELATI